MVMRWYRQRLAYLGILPAVMIIVAAWPAVIPAQTNEDPVLVRIPLGKGQIVVSMLTLREHVGAGEHHDPGAEQVLLNLLSAP